MKDIRLWGILIIALAVRTVMLFAVFEDVRRARTPDSEDYEDLALQLIHDREYRARWESVPPTPPPEVFRTPGYPALLAGAYWATPVEYGGPLQAIFPLQPLAIHPTTLRIILGFQVLLDLHLVLLTFFLGRSLAGQGVGLMAALFQAASPLAAAASCRILSDGVFAFMLTAAVLLLLRHFRTGGWYSLVLSALIMGASCYVRPVGLAFSAVMALVVLCSRRGTGRSTAETAVLRRSARPRRLLRTAAFASIIIACIAPWVARNATVADYRGFSSFATDSMYWYSAAEIEARHKHLPVEKVREEFQRAEGWDSFDPDLIGQPGLSNAPCYRTAGGIARFRWDKARAIILAHPWDFLSIHLKGDIAFWLPGAPDALEVLGYTSGGKGTLNVLHRQGLFAAARHYFGDNTTAMVLAGAMAVIFLVRCIGVVLCGLWKLRPRMTVGGWLCVLLVLTAWVLPGPANHPRFRVPVEPILSAAAAIGWLGLAQWRRRRRAAGET